MVEGILSERLHRQWPSWFTVYEWEDIMAAELGLEIVSSPCRVAQKLRYYGWKYFGLFSRFNGHAQKLNLMWIMASSLFGQYTYKGLIPIFLDTPLDTLKSVYVATRSLPCFWVTCYDFYQELVKIGADNVFYMPLSIADQYLSAEVPEKKIDVIQVGRKNNVLHGWMLQYCEEHPKVEYIYQMDGGSLAHNSTIRGNIGKLKGRSDYMNMLKATKVSLVSTPGCDNSKDFGGLDFVTPRFYESISCYCYLIGRYTHNWESELLHLESLCPNVQNYEEFSSNLAKVLSYKEFHYYDTYRTFLLSNSTKARVKEMKNILESMKLR